MAKTATALSVGDLRLLVPDARIESRKRELSIPTLQRILAGAGLELRFRPTPVDDDDEIVVARESRRSDQQKAAAAARRAHNVEQFAANAEPNRRGAAT
jgi:hypothetical protein